MSTALIERVEVEALPVPAMKLSEAMRKGAAIRPQGFFSFFPPVWNERKGEYSEQSCAMGAAYEAATGENDLDLLDSYMQLEIMRSLFGDIPEDIQYEIMQKNDTMRWSREKIADWLESKGF